MDRDALAVCYPVLLLGEWVDTASLWIAGASAVSILFSIAVSQILLGFGFLLLLISGRKVRVPPIALPVALFFAVTLLAALASGDAVHAFPQVRKFFVFLIVPLIYSTFGSVKQVRGLVLAWTGVAFLSALRSLVQFAWIVHEAHTKNANNYAFYLYHRTTGFASHWMTFGGEEMVVLLMLGSLVLFSRERRFRWQAWVCLPFLLAALVLGLTRSIFLVGVPVGALYLLWVGKRWLLTATPLIAALLWTIAPGQVRDRVISAVRPNDQMDSNSQRAIMRRTGMAMIAAHPWLGLGPEQIAPQFQSYVPADIPRPLPSGWYGHLHNIYLQYAAERGVPALLILLWLIGKALSDFVRGLRAGIADEETAFVLHGAIAVTVAILASGFFEYNLGDSEVLTLFLSVVSCGYVALRAQFHGDFTSSEHS